jgi:hypothetical protein
MESEYSCGVRRVAREGAAIFDAKVARRGE